MKTPLFLLLIALTPLVASAQIQLEKASNVAPQISIDPASRALLDQAMATYQGLTGLSYQIVTSTAEGNEVDHSSASFKRPNLINAQTSRPPALLHIVNDGSNFYSLGGPSHQKEALEVDNALSSQGIAGVAGNEMGQLLGGKDPVEFFQRLYNEGGFHLLKSTTVALPSQVVDGETLRGVRSNYSWEFRLNKNQRSFHSREITFWFQGSKALLRRVDIRGPQEPLGIQRISNQQLNPTFAPGTFKFNPGGLQPR